MTRLKFHTQALLLFATIAFTSSQNDWKPIISSGDVLNGQANLQYSIGLDTNGHNPASSSSKSSITFNGQTISTAIHNPGPVLSVSSPGLPATDIGIDHKARYLDYGNYLTGLFGPTSNQVSVDWNHSFRFKLSQNIHGNFQNCINVDQQIKRHPN